MDANGKSLGSWLMSVVRTMMCPLLGISLPWPSTLLVRHTKEPGRNGHEAPMTVNLH